MHKFETQTSNLLKMWCYVHATPGTGLKSSFLSAWWGSNLIWCLCADVLGSFGYTHPHITLHCSEAYLWIHLGGTVRIKYYYFFQFVYIDFDLEEKKKKSLIYSGWACLVHNALSDKDRGELWVHLCRSSWPALISSWLFAFSFSHQTDTIQLGCLH